MSIKEIVIYLLVAIILGVISYLWKTNKATFKATLTNMIQQLEIAIRGSKMGAVRKQMLLEMLRAANGTVPGWVSGAIDEIVEYLNKNRAWLTEFMGGGLPDDLQKLIDEHLNNDSDDDAEDG